MTPAISLDHVTKHFGNKQVLQGVSFSIDPGTIVGYIGPNGAGKSTTVKIILGLLQQDGGTINLFGTPLRPEDNDYKRRIGYVPESADVFDALTAREYLTLIGQVYGLSADVAEAKAQGLATVVGLAPAFDRRIAGYSKGMRQLVLIIASLLHNPDLLFWDEPLNGLDANTVLIVEEILQELRNRGKTIFYSSHIMDVVQKLSDRIILLNDGVVAADGAFKDIAGAVDANAGLQELFSQLTGFNEHGQRAKEFVDLVMGGDAHD
ncbi:ABC transporter ATP-binding protein [Lacticaseibacillus nasuensis]|uniref:Abc transporter, atp-binding protein n=1 Tax=Lacticaseibacillus nasuensis JCM 17158 TaxID=1291734 RepID=A0A0R1JQY9_9LACO|nr:ABC transporter ATP-binding protein [Lacticaseibacillus nasuensis]KRK73814.1 abc transporter, atp-binding protein [Lacticaseibacillus nasuensis JCM 17158]MCX2455867.1 ABC transporter ATP-binding protein [Lacticaseibacillus nasuensis]